MNSIYLLFCREEKMIILNCAVKKSSCVQWWECQGSKNTVAQLGKDECEAV